jgi:hypothetical protein
MSKEDAGGVCPPVSLKDLCVFVGYCPPPTWDGSAAPTRARCGAYDATIEFQPRGGYGGDFVALYDATGRLVGVETDGVDAVRPNGHYCYAYAPSFRPIDICACDPLPARCVPAITDASATGD